MSTRNLYRPLALAAFLAVASLAAGCGDGDYFRTEMYDQEKYEPYEKSTLFADDSSARPFPDGTVARGHLAADRVYHTGSLASGEFVRRIPAPPAADEPPAGASPAVASEGDDGETVLASGSLGSSQPRELTAEFLRRGQQRYGIFCAPCHGGLGDGNGMIVQRGYQRPASYHEARLRDMPDGYFFDVISRGFGQMPAYASQVPVDDRWAIVAYVRALQLSQNARLADLPDELRSVADRALDAAERRAAGETMDDTDHDAHSTDGH